MKLNQSMIPAVDGTGPESSPQQQPQVFDNIPVQPPEQPPVPPSVGVHVFEFEPHMRDPQVNGLYRPKNLNTGEGEIVVLAFHKAKGSVVYRTANKNEEPTEATFRHFHSVFVPVVRTAGNLPVVNQKYAERLKPHNKIVVTEVSDGTVYFRNIYNARIHGVMDLVKFEDGFAPSN